MLVSQWSNEFFEVLSYILFFRGGQKAGCVLDNTDSCNNRRGFITACEEAFKTEALGKSYLSAYNNNKDGGRRGVVWCKWRGHSSRQSWSHPAWLSRVSVPCTTAKLRLFAAPLKTDKDENLWSSEERISCRCWKLSDFLSYEISYSTWNFLFIPACHRFSN